MSTAKSASRVWFITGSSQGLGRALFDVVLGAGDRAVATLRRPEQLESLKSQYPPSQLLVLQLDVTETFQIESAFEETQRHFGRIDVVVNNAGYALSSEIETTPLEEAKKQLDVLLWGPVQILFRPSSSLEILILRASVGIFLILVLLEDIRETRIPVYKYASALEGFTESLAREVLPEWNITATIIEPGGFRTELGSAAVRLPTLDVYKQDHAPSQAMARIREPKAWIGDPTRAGQVLFKLGGRRDLPMRVQLGTDASRLVRWKAKRTMEDTMNPEWEELADSTNVDGVDKETVLQRIEAAWRKV